MHDLSLHPDISDLYLAADVLVTDYSSVMFDSAVTRKPIVFFVYDLDRYRDELRGTYHDLAEIAPGPLLRSSEEVGTALADLASLRDGYAPAYDRFLERFCALEDGRATTRVLDRFFPGGRT